MSAFSRLASTTTLLALAAACDGSRPNGANPEATLQGTTRAGAADVRANHRLPVIVVRGVETRTTLEVPPAEMRSALAGTYRVPPDRRILGAVAEAHHLLSGRPPDTVTTTFRDGKWAVDYAGERVGELPDLPGFDDGTKLLVEWALRLIQRHPVDRGDAPASDALSRAQRMLSQPKPVNLLTGLESIDRAWQKTPRREWLPPAAEGLVLLALQLPRGERVGDPIAARAFAVLALAWASNAADSLTAVSLLRPFSLLAEYMGYSADARALGAGLPAGDAVRKYVERDVAGLRAGSEPLARFLYLAELARSMRGEPWRVWYDRIASRNAGSHDHDDGEYEENHGRPFEKGSVSSGVLGRGLEFGRFRSDATIPQQLPAQLGVELRALAAKHGRSLEQVDAWEGLLDDPLAGLSLLQNFRGSQITYVLEQGATERRRRALQQFDSDVGAAAAGFGGRLVDAAIVRTYFRAQMHHGYERACINRVVIEESSDATIFANAFSSARDPLWAESSSWCGQLARDLEEYTESAELIGTIRKSPTASDPALSRVIDLVEHHFTNDDFVELDVARAIFAQLDSRPVGLHRAGLVAGRMLNDLPLVERYYDRLTALAPDDYEYVEVWYAFYRKDMAALARIASNERFDYDPRLDALKYMLKRGGSADSAVAFAQAREIAAEPGCPWEMRDDVVKQTLERARRFEDAANVYRTWLDAHREAHGDAHTYAKVGLARQYHSMGRLDDAWRALPESVRECQRAAGKDDTCNMALGALQRAALIALDRGDIASAREFARYIRRSFRSITHARLTLAEIEWRTGNDVAAAQIIAEPRYQPSSDEWYEIVAPGFLRVVGRRPIAEATRAFVTLISADIDPAMLAIIPRVAWMQGRPEIAAALGKELARVADPEWANPQVYHYIKTAHGDSAALSWITRRWAPPQGLATALAAYGAREFDLLWALTPPPDSVGKDGSFIWLMRALGEQQQLTPDPKRRRALEQHYRAAGQGAYDVAGRYLIGLEPEEKIVALATSPKRRVEYSYYLAIKALGEGRHRDASDWLHITLETRQTDEAEFEWAKELLDDWWRAERTVADAARHVITSPLP